MSLGWIFFDTTVCFYVCGISMLLLARKLGFAEKRLPYVVLWYIGISVLDTLIRMAGMNPLLSFLVLLGATVLCAVYVFNGSLARRILWGCVGAGLGQVSVNLTIAGYLLAGYKDVNRFPAPSHTSFIILIGDMMLMTFLYFIICNTGNKKAAYSRPAAQIAIMGIFVFVLIATQQVANLYSFYGTAKPVNGPDTSESMVMLASGLLVVFFAVLCIFEYTGTLARRQKEAEMELERKRMETAYLEQANMTYQALRAWKHDYQNHMEVLHSLLQHKKYREMEDYLSQMNAEAGPSLQLFHTGNSVADAVLSGKLYLAKTRGIEVNAVAVLPGELTIPDVQFGSVLANLLDNAIEAQGAVSKPFINLSVRRERGMLQVRVENSANGSYRYEGGRLASTKTDKGHGVGLANITKIVDKAGGIMDIQPLADRFCVKILLPLKTESGIL